MSPDGVDVITRLLVVVIGDARALPGSALAGLATSGARVARFPTPDAAVEWLGQLPGPGRVVRVGELEIDRDLRAASGPGGLVPLTEQEVDILLALAEAPGRRLTFRELDHQVWGDRHRRDTQRIRSAIKRLRRKLADAEVPCAVQAVRGYGFRLVPRRSGGDSEAFFTTS